VIEDDKCTARSTMEARDRHRGILQGSPISPLLANLYFRCSLLAWERMALVMRWHVSSRFRYRIETLTEPSSWAARIRRKTS
jgi:hypothetical protein